MINILKDHELHIGDRQFIYKIKKRVGYLQALMRSSGCEIERKIKSYSIEKDKAKDVTDALFKKLKIDEIKKDKNFLKNVCLAIEEQRLLILEYRENYNKRYKASIEGFHLSPFTIVTKKTKYFHRRIFLIAYLFGCFLTNEEVHTDELTKWCVDFAFSFLDKKDINSLCKQAPFSSHTEKAIYAEALLTGVIDEIEAGAKYNIDELEEIFYG